MPGRKFPLICMLSLLLTLTTYATSQDKVAEGQETRETVAAADDKTPPTPAETKEKQPETKTVIVIFCQENINKILVVKTDGTWIADARGVSIRAAINGATLPEVVCVMYKGLFRPTTPKTQTWYLQSVMTAPNAEFQKILDGLQNGEFKLPGTETTGD